MPIIVKIIIIIKTLKTKNGQPAKTFLCSVATQHKPLFDETEGTRTQTLNCFFNVIF